MICSPGQAFLSSRTIWAEILPTYSSVGWKNSEKFTVSGHRVTIVVPRHALTRMSAEGGRVRNPSAGSGQALLVPLRAGVLIPREQQVPRCLALLDASG